MLIRQSDRPEKYWLTPGGFIAALSMAFVFVFSGPATFMLPLILLVGGSLLSKLNRDEKEKQGRDTAQVLANGLVGCLCLLVYIYQGRPGFEDPFFLAYLVSFVISICDTFSSETGKFFRGRTLDIIKLRPVEPGLSGGVSFAGTFAGIVASAFSALLVFWMFKLSFNDAVIVFISGFAGMLLDSMLGSVLQARYINDQGHIEEIPQPGNHLFKGFAWCNNDMVNLLSNVVTVAVFLSLY